MTARLRLARGRPAAGVILLLGLSSVCAAGTSSTKQAEAKSAALLQVRQQQLTQHQAQVSALQQEVAKQEAATRQASDRLKQQDQAIKKMQQELRALRPGPAAGHR